MRKSFDTSTARPHFTRDSAPEKSSRRDDKTERFTKPKPPRTRSASFAPKDPNTSWGEVAMWYDKHLSEEDTYHEKVLLPNLLRLVAPAKGETILDIACGQGYFTKAFAKKGATAIGVDVSQELIDIAKEEKTSATFHVDSAEALATIKDGTVDKATMVLAIQNIEHVSKVMSEAARVLKAGGEFHIVMNHPAFRVPKQSSWEYDDKKKAQFRRVDEYLSESRSAIEMHPGVPGSPQTISFHRPLQYYFKMLGKTGLAIDRLEEWISHRASDSGPRAKAENTSRKEIPLFLYLRTIKQK